MLDQQDLLQRFDFDLWANKRWLEALQKKVGVETDRAVFAHILSASEIWLQRCNGLSPSSMPVVAPNQAELERIRQGWTAVLTRSKEDPVIVFRRTNGEQHELSLSQIAAHVLNHGTYHRGELRGLCRARADDEFPETDIGLWFMLVANRA